MRVGLVLGAGGIQGGAWLTGGLHALATETGWDPMEAKRIVGTSAGSMIGSIVAAGTPVWWMVAQVGLLELCRRAYFSGDGTAVQDDVIVVIDGIE